MAISTEAGILAMLKTFYAKEGLVNLLYRNDPFLKIIKRVRVEGKQQNFAALVSQGGAVSANARVAEKLATEDIDAKEWQVIPGQLFSATKFNNKELLASRTQRGAYMPIAAGKVFKTSEAFRKTLALCLYGTGHGELFQVSAAVNVIAGDVDVEFPRHAVVAIGKSSELEFKATKESTTVLTTVKVKKINGTTVTLTGTEAVTVPANSWLCLAGCTYSDGTPMLPIGLAGWLPSGNISDSDNFYGVNRSDNREALAGTVIHAANGQKKYQVIEDAILRLSAMGSLCDIIVMNDEDRLAMKHEIDDRTYFTKVDGGKRAKAETGYDDFGFTVNDNWLGHVIGSAFCPKGTAYILSSDTIELWTYTNTDRIADGVASDAPGKPDVTGETDIQDKPYQLLVDDLFSIKSGETGIDGDVAIVKMNFFGTFVVTNTSVNAVVTF